MEGVEARLAMDSRDSALRKRRVSDDGGLSSANPVSGRDAPRLLNTLGGGLWVRCRHQRLNMGGLALILLWDI